MTVPVALIAAVARNGVIGVGNRMPWRLPGDFAQFRRATMGKPVLMGRKTFESIGRPLPGRAVLVVSRDPAFAPDGVAVVRSIEDGLVHAQAVARARSAGEIMVAGGATLYAALIGTADLLYITEVDLAPAGDAVFPAIDPQAWRETSRVAAPRRPDDEAASMLVTYVRG